MHTLFEALFLSNEMINKIVLLFYSSTFLIILDNQDEHLTQEKIPEVIFLEYCSIGLRDLETKKVEVEVFGEFWNVVLEENGEDTMVTENN